MKLILSISLILISIILKAQSPNWGWALPITVTQSGNNLNCSVFDPVQNQTKTTSISNNSTYINSQGVVASVYNGSIYVVTYDINLHQFKTDSWGSYSTISNLSNSNGVVAWIGNNSVKFAIYDPSQLSWEYDSWGSYSTISNLSNSNGVVAWIGDNSVKFAVYDPSQLSWEYDSWGSYSTVSNLSNSNGVVAWIGDNSVKFAVYDPSQLSWEYDSWGSYSTVSNLSNSNGVVAWIGDNSVRVAVYDPSQLDWEYDSWGSYSSVSNMYTIDGTLYYTANSSSYKYGYNKNSHSWQSNYNTDLNCKLFVVKPTTNPNRIVYLWCLTYGANSFSYNCGDGHTITNRWAWKQYNNSGSYTPELTIFNSSNNSTCNEMINFTGTTDIETISEAENAVSVYPNPNNGEFILELNSDSKVVISDAIGRIILSKGFGSGKQTVDLNNQENGVYFIKVTENNRTYTQKVVINK